MTSLNLGELQDMNTQMMAAESHIQQLEEDIEDLNDKLDRMKRRHRTVQEQNMEMIRFIVTTTEFYAFILEREWKDNATDGEMVMAFLASRTG